MYSSANAFMNVDDKFVREVEPLLLANKVSSLGLSINPLLA